MELTEKELLEKAKSQLVLLMPEEKGFEYYKGFYEGVQAMLKIIKERD